MSTEFSASTALSNLYRILRLGSILKSLQSYPLSQYSQISAEFFASTAFQICRILRLHSILDLNKILHLRSIIKSLQYFSPHSVLRCLQNSPPPQHSQIFTVFFTSQHSQIFSPSKFFTSSSTAFSSFISARELPLYFLIFQFNEYILGILFWNSLFCSVVFSLKPRLLLDETTTSNFGYPIWACLLLARFSIYKWQVCLLANKTLVLLKQET
jgi:hypothetical protein